jgi:hypothetical protein
MNPPVFLYYQLEGFYQNQRDYVKSRDYGQMRAEYTNVSVSFKKSSSVNTKCQGALTIKEVFDGDKVRYTNKWKTTFKENDLAVPCGLVAKSFFNGLIILIKTLSDYRPQMEQ